MVIKMKLEGMWGQRGVKIKARENSISELLIDPKTMKWLLDKFMRKTERVVEIEIKEDNNEVLFSNTNQY